MMLGRAAEHYYHSLKMLEDAGEASDKRNEIISTINSLKFTHSEWQKTAISSLYEHHPFKKTVRWYDWRTAMQSLESSNLSRRNRK